MLCMANNSRYLAHGTTTDCMYDVARVPMAFTFEIYGDPKASSNYCFKLFNPIDIASFNMMKSMLENLNHFYLSGRCLVGSSGGSVGCLAHGTATVYMYDVARVPMAFTFKMYGDPKESPKDCFKMFNPVDIASFNTFRQHAREIITTELALRLLFILREEEFLPNVDRAASNRTLDRLVTKVVPMENLNGRKLVEEGELCERRNGRGVDLNRNRSVDWGKKEKDYDPYEENPGTALFSEPEAQIMRKLSVSFEPHIWVNMHSGMEALFMPYDHKNTTPDGIPTQMMKSVLEDLNHFYLNDRYLVGFNGVSVRYLAHGTATDYMYDVAQVLMAFTFEIYGDPKALSKDRFKMFNPVDITSFNTFGQHALELITTELALRLLFILSEEEFLPNVDRAASNRTLDRLVTKVVPMENLNGRKLLEDGALCEKKNGRGVDLNRNWSVDWGKKEKDYDPYEENPGTTPFSEPEVQIMRKLHVSYEPHIWVNVHSRMEALFMPYDHKNTTPDGIPTQMMKSMLEDLNHFYLNDCCLVGSGGGSVGYLAHGTATDYVYAVARVPTTFTFEIYGDPKASSKDCFKMFNPVDIASFNKVLNWSAAFFKMFSIDVQQIDGLQSNAVASNFDKWVSIYDYLNYI